jgi:glycine/D-amino acid oxidase-like deaminating enzyme
MMRIAVIGAGFSGLASCWHLLNQFPKASLVLFDPKGLGGGASGIAAGLLHPFVGAHAKLNWRGLEGYAATCKLLQIATEMIAKPVAKFSGILRLAISEMQKDDFAKCAALYKDVAWWEVEKCLSVFPQIAPHPGIYLQLGATVDPKLYLEGLWLSCKAKGAVLRQEKVSSLEELKDFDLILAAIGADINELPELKSLRITPVKGQILEVAWPQDAASLPFPLNSQAYLICNEEGDRCIAGATYEKEFQTREPDASVALAEIIPKAQAILPLMKNAELVECRAALRASTPNHLPFVTQIDKKTWAIGGMGSKGLLYHALMAQELAYKTSEVTR